jgi:hypothetical protein
MRSPKAINYRLSVSEFACVHNSTLGKPLGKTVNGNVWSEIAGI